MKTKYLLFLCILLLILNSSFLIGTVRYVSKTGSSTFPYTSWESAADSIQKCINICSFGDTIYVANGIYKEQVIMIRGLSLIGAGMDSCVVDTRELLITSLDISITVADSCTFTGFKIIAGNNNSIGIGIAGRGSRDCLITQNRITSAFYGIFLDATFFGLTDMTIYKNICDDVRVGTELFNSNAIIRKNIISVDFIEGRGISIGAFDFTYKPIIDSNYIEVNGGDGIRNSIGSKPTITNNTILIKYAPEGIYTLGWQIQ